MTPVQLIVLLAAFASVLFAKGIYDHLKNREKIKRKVRDSFGHMPENHYDAQRYQMLSYYLDHSRHDGDAIDEITWNDLDMELVFMMINQTCTGMGEEYLYAMLHRPEYMPEVLSERNRRVSAFEDDEALRLQTGVILNKIGKLSKFSIFGYVDLLLEAKGHKPYMDILVLLAMIVSTVMAFTVSDLFIFVIIALLAVNVVTYFMYKNRIYFSSFGYVTRIVRQINRLTKIDAPKLSGEMDELKKHIAPMLRLGRLSPIFCSGIEMGGTLGDLFMDYIKMAFHLDLMLFDFALSSLKRHQDDLMTVLKIAGELDADMAVASFRKMKGTWCIPKLYEDSEDAQEMFVSVDHMRHPLIDDPVPASFETDRSMLLTGSNASGKSTFLKAFAVNAILAQTIDTVLAEHYCAPYFRIYSSMALRDNLMGSESYFMVEIKSLKRIYEAAKGEIPMLCVIDEVLRGTNTVERIAASSQILAKLAASHAMCIAATHDIELTYILESAFDNWHFKEDIRDGEIFFDYELHPGRAVSRNAIRLLDMIGFDADVTGSAEASAAYFEAHNAWLPIEIKKGNGVKYV